MLQQGVVAIFGAVHSRAPVNQRFELPSSLIVIHYSNFKSNQADLKRAISSARIGSVSSSRFLLFLFRSPSMMVRCHASSPSFLFSKSFILVSKLLMFPLKSNTLFTIFRHPISGRDLILIIGGLFLLYKSTKEIHENFESDSSSNSNANFKQFNSYSLIIIQIAIMDIIFSLDSVITAVGLVKHIEIMIIAIVIAIIFMLFMSKKISAIIHQHPSLKMLALSFLILVGVTLIGEGLRFTIPKEYIYFSMAFSFLVELLNIKIRNNKHVK